jgi:predicted lactoylglutathione lyase
MATTSSTSRKLFVNLPVRDLKKSKDFFGALGFTFNPQFTDDNAACMVLSEEGFVMLLQEPYFKTFTTRAIADARQQTGGIYALSCTSRAEVDDLLKKAVAAGGTTAMPSKDYGFMYSNSFYDLDGHHWEVLWMDPSAVQQ